MSGEDAVKGFLVLVAKLVGAGMAILVVLEFGGDLLRRSPSGAAADSATSAAEQSSPSMAPLADAQRRVAACGETPVYIFESPATLFGASRATELPAKRQAAERYVGCLRDVLDTLEASDAAAIAEVRDDLRDRVRYVDERLRVRAELARESTALTEQIAALGAMFGRCPDPPMGELLDEAALRRFREWLDCRRNERDAVAAELAAVRRDSEQSAQTDEVRRSLARLDERVEAASAQIATAEQRWTVAARSMARGDGASQPREEAVRWYGSSARTQSRPRDDGPPCTCDDARRGVCGSPATHCASAEEIAARRLASRRSAAAADARRRDRESQRTERERQAQRDAADRNPATTSGRVLAHTLRGEGTTRVQACHNARASAVHQAFAPLSFSEYRDFDSSLDVGSKEVVH